jgi:hypothetical protein
LVSLDQPLRRPSKAPLQRQPSTASIENQQSLDGYAIYEARAVAAALVFCFTAAIRVFAHDCPLAERLIRRVNHSKHMLGDKADDSAALRGEPHERGYQASHSQSQQQETTVQLQQASLQASLADRKCLQQVEGLQAHRKALR